MTDNQITFDEYLKQSERRAIHSVIVTEEHCQVVAEHPIYINNIKQNTKLIYLHTFSYSYLADQSGDMWTMDEQGNPKSRSVFKYKEKL